MNLTPDPDPRAASWGWPPLPSWVKEFRPFQLTAVAEAMNLYASGRRVVWLDAPTGSGKTLIAEMVRRCLSDYYPALYVATTKTLQDQFAHDFPYAAVIKGRANYPTLDHPEKFPALNAGDCTKQKVYYPGCDDCHRHVTGDEPAEDAEITHCHHCHPVWKCPYEVAKQGALASRAVTVANTAFLLAEANTAGRFSAWDEGRQRTDGHPFSLMVVDEADALESELMGFAEWRLPKRLARELGLNIPPPHLKTKPESWAAWAEHVAQPALAARVAALEAAQTDPPTPEQTRRLRAAQRLYEGLVDITARLGDNWVYTGYETGDIQFKPVTVHDRAPAILWRHALRWLAMSATIISPAQMSADTGLAADQWGQVFITEGFPAERRPVFVRFAADMRQSTKTEEWPKMAKGVSDLIARYTGERILVHTVSYNLAAFLMSECDHQGRGITYHSASDRTRAVERFKREPDGVLFASSLERGIDLPDDLCRVVIVAKIPYPYLGDKQVSARLYGTPGGQGWYSMMAVRSLVQMTGRAMRHERDYADNWILDRQFLTVWERNRSLLPRWWQAALQWYPDRFGDHRVRWAGLAP